MEGLFQSLDAPLNKGYEIFRKHSPKMRIKKKSAIGPKKGVSQENLDQILALKSQEERGRIVGKFCMADTV